MPKQKSQAQTELQLAKEVNKLTKEVKNLKELEFVQILKKPFRLMWLSLLKGIMVGFGTVIGATVVVAFFIYLIGQISLVPILGDFIQDIINRVSPNTATTEMISAPK